MSEKAINLVTMPKWGLAIHEGTIVEWRKREGERVAVGEPLCDIETTKITNEFESPFAGTLVRIVKPIGSIVEVGEIIALITEGPADEGEISFLLESQVARGGDDMAATSGPVTTRVDTPSGTFSYLGIGPVAAEEAVLFLHGFGGDHTNWGLLQAELAVTVRAVAVDLPGHGGSNRNVGAGSADDLAQAVCDFVDVLGLKRVNLVAHSFGAAVALRLAAQRPAQVASLLLIAPARLGALANPDYIRGFLAAERKRDMKPVLEMLFSDPRMLGRTMVNDALALLRDDGARQALRLIGAHVLQPTSTELEDDLALLSNHRSIVIWGTADIVMPMPSETAARIAGRLHLIPGVGHMPQAERPELVAHALRELIGLR